MYNIKLGYGCGVKATLLTPSGALCDLRRARHIGATLVLPSGATMPCRDVSFNEITNAVYVRLLADRELTAEGEYGIIFNVKAEEGATYSTSTIRFAEVHDDAPMNYLELTIAMSIGVVDFPENVACANPRNSGGGSWNIFSEELGKGIIARPIIKALSDDEAAN